MVIVTVPQINCPSVQLQILTGALRCNIAGSKLQHALEIAVPLCHCAGIRYGAYSIYVHRAGAREKSGIRFAEKFSGHWRANCRHNMTQLD